MAHLRLVLTDNNEAMRAFTVEWDRKRQKFVAKDDHGALLGISPNQSNAIGSAIREARTASREGCRVLVQVLQQNGTLRNEFIAQPPPPRL
ncbi:MAG TPA: hypothetical protein VGM68_01295 [Rhizomicrobium sp.]|jgi:hypothetical protein